MVLHYNRWECAIHMDGIRDMNIYDPHHQALLNLGRDVPVNVTHTYDDDNENGYEGQCANMVVSEEGKKG